MFVTVLHSLLQTSDVFVQLTLHVHEGHELLFEVLVSFVGHLQGVRGEGEREGRNERQREGRERGGWEEEEAGRGSDG